MKTKCLVLVVLLRKQIITLKLQKLKNKLNNHNHNKYIATPEFNTLAADVFNARLAQANLITKTDFNYSVSSLNSKIVAKKRKNKSIENEIKKS